MFVQVVRLAREMGLVKLGTVAMDGTKVKANAEVLLVTRSNSNLAVGDRITIKYTHNKTRKHWAGPRPIPILRKKAETDAFLAFDAEQNCYVPSARGASFEPLIREY